MSVSTDRRNGKLGRDSAANDRDLSSSSSSSESDSDSESVNTDEVTEGKMKSLENLTDSDTAVVSELGNTSLKALRDLIRQSAHANGLESNAKLIQQVINARELIKVRHSMFVLGAEAIGKTELWRTLAHLNTRTGKSTVYSRISPKTLHLTEFFGRLNDKTKSGKMEFTRAFSGRTLLQT